MYSDEQKGWEKHPNYPRQALLLESHATFRRMSDYLIERVATIAIRPELSASKRSRLLKKSGDFFEDWMSAMRSHESYEERKLYPFLSGKFGENYEPLVSQHEELHREEAQVRDAFAKAVGDANDDGKSAPWPYLGQALTRHKTTLLAHLAQEEAMVVPRLLELSPQEFDDYEQMPRD